MCILASLRSGMEAKSTSTPAFSAAASARTLVLGRPTTRASGSSLEACSSTCIMSCLGCPAVRDPLQKTTMPALRYCPPCRSPGQLLTAARQLLAAGQQIQGTCRVYIHVRVSTSICYESAFTQDGQPTQRIRCLPVSCRAHMVFHRHSCGRRPSYLPLS